MSDNEKLNEADDSGLSSHDLFAFAESDQLYIVKDSAGEIQRAIMINSRSKKWGLFMIGDPDPYNSDQYRHDLMERNNIRIANANVHGPRP